MLVLSRKAQESVLIGDSIEVKVIAISDNRVKLGITAPEGVKVDRREVREAIARQNAVLKLHGGKRGELAAA